MGISLCSRWHCLPLDLRHVKRLTLIGSGALLLWLFVTTDCDSLVSLSRADSILADWGWNLAQTARAGSRLFQLLLALSFHWLRFVIFLDF